MHFFFLTNQESNSAKCYVKQSWMYNVIFLRNLRLNKAEVSTKSVQAFSFFYSLNTSHECLCNKAFVHHITDVLGNSSSYLADFSKSAKDGRQEGSATCPKVVLRYGPKSSVCENGFRQTMTITISTKPYLNVLKSESQVWAVEVVRLSLSSRKC